MYSSSEILAREKRREDRENQDSEGINLTASLYSAACFTWWEEIITCPPDEVEFMLGFAEGEEAQWEVESRHWRN